MAAASAMDSHHTGVLCRQQAANGDSLSGNRLGRAACTVDSSGEGVLLEVTHACLPDCWVGWCVSWMVKQLSC